MLRITEHIAAYEFSITLEGCLSGPSVTELAHCWLDAATLAPRRRIVVYMADVCHVDKAGRELMTLMYRTGVGFVTKGFVMPEIVREISEAVDNTRRD